MTVAWVQSQSLCPKLSADQESELDTNRRVWRHQLNGGHGCQVCLRGVVPLEDKVW